MTYNKFLEYFVFLNLVSNQALAA